MVTKEEKIRIIKAQLAQIEKIQFAQPTAQQLHRQRFALLDRIQRKEDKRWQQKVGTAKKILTQQLLDLRTKEFPTTQTFIPSPTRILTRVESRKRLRGVR